MLVGLLVDTPNFWGNEKKGLEIWPKYTVYSHTELVHSLNSMYLKIDIFGKNSTLILTHCLTFSVKWIDTILLWRVLNCVESEVKVIDQSVWVVQSTINLKYVLHFPTQHHTL